MRTQLTDGRVVITRYAPAHAGRLYEAARESIETSHRWLPWCHPDYALEESRTWIESQRQKWDAGEEYQFAVEDALDRRYLGGCGLNALDPVHRRANLGYWVRASEHGRGTATAAARLAAAFGLGELRLLRIEIVVPVENLASRRVAERVGAVREGVLRNRLLIHGRAHDAIMYSLVPETAS